MVLKVGVEIMVMHHVVLLELTISFWDDGAIIKKDNAVICNWFDNLGWYAIFSDNSQTIIQYSHLAVEVEFQKDGNPFFFHQKDVWKKPSYFNCINFMSYMCRNLFVLKDFPHYSTSTYFFILVKFMLTSFIIITSLSSGHDRCGGIR